MAEAKITDAEVRADWAPNYVHITADGQMTSSWGVAGSRPTNPLVVEKLTIRVCADLAGASYVWLDNSVPGAKRVSAVMQVFQRQQGRWRMISTQVGGRQPIDGRIVATGMTAPVNPSEAENEG